MIEKILYGHLVDMGGIKVRQPFPTNQVDQLDPFLLLHHHKTQNKPNLHPREVGVGPHPHRGFSPVTFIFEGSLHHRDSRGNSSIVDSGGAQWMDAGMGIIHSERPSAAFAQKGGAFEIIQLWINLPKKHKMDQPVYQAIPAAKMEKVYADSGEGVLDLVSGKLDDKSGIVKSKTPIITAMGNFKKEASKSLILEEGLTSAIYLLDGELRIKGFGMVEGLNLIAFQPNTKAIEITALQDTRFLFIAGKPINEPVETYGPFVMTNQTEIMEAMRDYQMGKMGILIEDF